MNECREIEPLLGAYADGGAAQEAHPRVEAHVEACEPCRDRLAAQRAVCDTLRARRDALRSFAPEGLKARCAAHAAARRQPPLEPARTIPMPPRLSRLRRWAPLTAAATFVLAVAAVFAMGLTDKAQALAFQATLDHVKCSRFNMTPAAADPVAAAERWHGRFGWSIKVPASASEAGLELKAVRRCAVTDGRVAHLMYLWDGEPLSVYVLPSKVVDSAELVHRFGHDALIWSQNGRTYIMIGRKLREPSVDAAMAYVRANVY